jgi:phage terminase large subunit
MKITLDPSAYSSKFYDVIHSWDRYIIAYGSRGSGKTESLLLKYLLSLFEPYYFKLAYINQEGSNIRDQQYAAFKRIAKDKGIYHQLKFYDGDYRIVNPRNDNALIPKGMDDPEKTKGLDNITAVYWDEINKGTPEGFAALNELLRSPQAEYLQFAMSFNPVRESHWLRKTFFHPDNAYKLHPDFTRNTLLNHSTYRDNEFIDQQEYYQTLVASAAGNSNVLRVTADGLWGLDENGNPWLHAFKEERHIGDVTFLPTYPVYLSFDFNRDPATCTAWQMSPNAPHNVKGCFVHCIEEFAEPVQLKELCERIKARFPNSMFFVTGDRTGKAGNVGFEQRNTNMYSLIASYLRISDRQIECEGKNLLHNDSRQLCNAVLYNHVNFKIATRCKRLISECQMATVDEKKTEAGVLLKDRQQHKMDLFDGMRYFFQTYFEDFSTRVKQVR